MNDELNAEMLERLISGLEELRFDLAEAGRGLPDHDSPDPTYSLRPVLRARRHFNAVYRLLLPDAEVPFDANETDLPDDDDDE